METYQEATVRERAYAIWEQEGRPDGREFHHWERAIHEIRALPRAVEPARAAAAKAAPAKKAPAKARGRIRAALKSAMA
jgi:hypothetical protein